MPDIKLTTQDGNSVCTYVSPEEYAKLAAEQSALETERFEKLMQSIVLAGALANPNITTTNEAASYARKAYDWYFHN